MEWNEIKLNKNQTGYSYKGQPLFSKKYQTALNFHKEGLAAVADGSGAYHIDVKGNPIYNERYNRTFGYYFNKAAILDNGNAYHIDINGKRFYPQNFLWTGNYQQDICVVKDYNDNYYHIDVTGKRLYPENYLYTGDFRENIACVQLQNDLFTHIYDDGSRVHDKYFEDLNVYHKGHACAKDASGWFHIDLKGEPLYVERYLLLEPFYNGAAFATDLDGKKVIVSDSNK